MATLNAKGCNVGTQSITIFFSEKVDQNNPPNLGGTDAASALNPANYNLFAPDAGFVNTAFTGTVKAADNRSVVLEFGNAVFSAGQWVQVTVTGVAAADSAISPIVSNHVSGRTPSDSARTTRDVEDAIAYPILTEEVAYRPSPVGISTSGAGGITGPGGSNLGQIAMQAVSDVLGWKANASDPKGFIGALTQSFTLTDVEGHVVSAWKPRSYAVQTDLGGGITGAQASLYMRAKDALDQSLSLLDGLYPLDPEADPEYVKALREMARSQMTEIVKEFGVVGLPSVLRINTYFDILLGKDASKPPSTGVQFDPDAIQGTLGQLRDTYGIFFQGNRFNNSVEDEQDITNFRVISDYMTSLLQSWIANRQFFFVGPRQDAFFGTQLVLISRQLNVISETVSELRFALDSVFIGPNERQTLLLEFRDRSLPPMFLEDILDEIGGFVGEEGPRLLRDGGKISVTNNIIPVVKSLKHMIEQARDPRDNKRIPDGFRTVRVRHALDDLVKQIGDLIDLTEQVEQSVPPSEDKLTISSIIATGDAHKGIVSMIGNAFDPEAEVSMHSSTAIVAKPGGTKIYTRFVSSQRMDVVIDDETEWGNLQHGSHTITLTNPNDDTVFVTLPNGLTPGPKGIVISDAQFTSFKKRLPAIKQASSVRRPFEVTVDGSTVPPGVPPAGGGSDPRIAAIQQKQNDLKKNVDALTSSQAALSEKVDKFQKSTEATLSREFADVRNGNKTMFQEMKSWVESVIENNKKHNKTRSRKTRADKA